MICSGLSKEQSNNLYLQVLRDHDIKAQRQLCREDLFYLIQIACKRKDLNKDWLYDRCREVEASPNDHLDLWAREHYKSTIITFAQSIQDILSSHGDNPLPKWKGREVTIGIFSCTRPLAKGFLTQIKSELENNTYLKDLFPDVLYNEPKRESPKWSLDSGIIVKRESNPKESTIEAWGLVDGQPTGKHFFIRVYDDVVTKESVTTPDMIKKVTNSWELSDNLGCDGGLVRYIGTRYHFNDTYRVMMERKIATERIYPATNDGTLKGKPIFLSREALDKKRRNQGPYTFSCQMLQNPTADKAMGFKEDWLKFYDELRNHLGWNYYILVDPAGEKKTTNDYTVMWVIGLGPDKNYYLVDGLRDRLNLTQRTEKLFQFVRKYKPLNTGYEKYGLQSDIEHIEYVMDEKNYRFKITKLGGSLSKNDRIRKLVPIYEQGRFWLPNRLTYIDIEGKCRDLVKEFIDDEFTAFPVAVHDDMMDCMARIIDTDLGVEFPKEVDINYLSITMENSTNQLTTDMDIYS
jgi:predicted phage terminase large subunit-like protein